MVEAISGSPPLGDNGIVDVLVVEDIWGKAFDSLAQTHSFRYEPDLWKDPDSLVVACSSARSIVLRNRTRITKELILGAPHLEVIARAGVGLDNIDLQAADEAGVVVVAALGANAQSVGEHALSMAFALAREIPGHDARTRTGEWDRRLGIELAGRTWGVIGLGAIGRVTARLACAIGMEVVGYDPYLPSSVVIDGLTRRVVDISELLHSSDFVSLHLPLTEETSDFVNAGFLSSMRSGSYLINSSRGGLVDEDALADALDEGRLAGAALDVRKSEPPAPHRLNQHPRVIMSPHIAGVTKESLGRVTAILADEIALVLGRAPATRAVGSLKLPRRETGLAI